MGQLNGRRTCGAIVRLAKKDMVCRKLRVAMRGLQRVNFERFELFPL